MDTKYSDDERMNKGSRGAPLLAGLMIGSLVGAGAMLLLAPQAGKETRQQLQEGAMEFKDRTTDNVRGAVTQVRSRAQQMASDVRGKANDLQNQGKDIAANQLDRVATAAQAGKKSIQSSKNHS